MKKIKEAGSVAIRGGNFNSDGPLVRRRTKQNFSGHEAGGYWDMADNTFGGIMGIGRIHSGLEDEEFEEDIDDILLQEINIKIPSLKSIMSTIGNAPVFGTIPNAISFLMSYFGPGGLQSSMSSFTVRLERLFKIELGKDILEAEFEKKENKNIPKSILEDKLSLGIDTILDILGNNPKKEIEYENLLATMPKSAIAKENIPLSETMNLNEVRDVLKKFDDILDELQYCLTAFFKIFQGPFAKLTLTFLEPIDFLNWLTSVYIKKYIKKMEAAFELPIIGDIAKYIGKPLDAIGHFDIFINLKKLKRLEKVQHIIKGLQALRATIEKKKGASDKSTDSKNIAYGTNLLLNQIFEAKSEYSLNFLMEDYLNKEIDKEKTEESFIEIDLEKDIDEQITMSGGGIQGTSNNSKNKKYFEIEKFKNEQIEWMRRLEMYHQKTTNKLK